MSGYAAASTVAEAPDGVHLDLATALGVTPSGPVENPVFFTGFVARPDVTVNGLLAVADVAASRYADPGLSQRLASLDPVVTAGGDRLRFESFSADNSVYARFDLDRAGLGSGEVGFGTTNIDINPPLRTALARMDRAAALHLNVGRDGLLASTPSGTHVERTVDLPDRWVRGFAEVPAISAASTPVAMLTGPAISRFFSGLPRVAPPGPTLHLIPLAAGLRTSRMPRAGTVALPGTARLRGGDRVLRFATRLTVHASVTGTTAWVLEVPGGRFTLVLSPDPFRGFSGEGTLLTLLTHPAAEQHGRALFEVLGWNPLIDAIALQTATGLDADAVAGGLAWLAACGRLGHDLTEGRYFHRELPVDSEKVLRRNPRLVEARALLNSGGVIADPNGTWSVRASHGDPYTVTAGPPPGCQCCWAEKYGDTRGPCKHILAVQLMDRR